MSKYLSRDEILQAQDFQTDVVEVPEWAKGGKVLVRELSAPEVLKIGFRSMADEKDEEGEIQINLAELGDNIPAMISWCVIDENGASVLSINDVNRLSAKSVQPVSRIIAKIMEISDLSPDEGEEQEGDEDEPAKNE